MKPLPAGRASSEGPLPFEPDPVIEAYMRDVDRSMVRESLKRTPDQRMRALVALQRFAAVLGRAGRQAAGR
jgi:hypothetical protein